MIADQEFDKGLLTLKMIWFAMLISQVLYLFVGLYIGTDLRPSMNEETFNLFRGALYVFAFVTLIISRFIRKLILSGRGQLKLATRAFQQSTLQRYTTATIVSLAMSESIGIYGLLLFFLGKNHMDLYLLLLISAAALWVYRPRKDELIHLARESPRDSSSGGAGA